MSSEMGVPNEPHPVVVVIVLGRGSHLMVAYGEPRTSGIPLRARHGTVTKSKKGKGGNGTEKWQVVRTRKDAKESELLTDYFYQAPPQFHPPTMIGTLWGNRKKRDHIFIRHFLVHFPTS